MDELYSELLKSKKYANIAPDVLMRVCQSAAARYPKKKEALKAAKTELHIIHESYLLTDCHKKAAELIGGYAGEDMVSDREFGLSLMKLHASSKERADHAETIYDFLSGFVDDQSVLGDIGCGFSPFALPFFRVRPARYLAYEINSETTDVLNRYFAAADKSGYHAETLDAVTAVPDLHFNTVFLFKLLPVLQQQKKGRAFEILDELDFDTAVVSFPLKSLSGKNKGMESHYSSFFEDGLPDQYVITDNRILGNEMFYVIKKHTEN